MSKKLDWRNPSKGKKSPLAARVFITSDYYTELLIASKLENLKVARLVKQGQQP